MNLSYRNIVKIENCYFDYVREMSEGMKVNEYELWFSTCLLDDGCSTTTNFDKQLWLDTRERMNTSTDTNVTLTATVLFQKQANMASRDIYAD